jgi:hypothetical protein
VSRPLGKTQRGVLRALQQHRWWEQGCGWHWNGYNRTEAILDSLVRRGLADREVMPVNPYGRGWTSRVRYTLTPAGEMLVGTLK